MPLRDLDYQARVLTRLDDYLTELAAQKAKADKTAVAVGGQGAGRALERSRVSPASLAWTRT